ncbi:GPR endopeptidase [Bacillota bacterium LX-D]|nr:GPR endopeptidase [Bacillota bacterium LX-D]
MNMLDFYKALNVQMDLALEATEVLRGDLNQELPGISEQKEQFANGSVTKIKVLNSTGEKITGKPIGTYLTIEAPDLKVNNRQIHQVISAELGKQIQQLFAELQLKKEASVLLVGLGNWEATPDALGPKVIEKSLVTRHLYHYAPEELRGGLREVSAFAPGVLGITGIETAEIIKGVVDRIHPSVVIAIDALAAANLERICTTIQLSNTGINPGSGIGNKRVGINQETMGVPVIAIGIPTVINAAVIAYRVFAAITSGNPYLTQQINEERISSIVGQILEPFGGQLTVTPKEIDELINNTARVIADGINQGLHPEINPENSAMYLQ